MKQAPNPHHRFPAEVISHAVWLYHVFSISLRDVELLLVERGIAVSYETVESIQSRGEPISTAFVESAVNEIVAQRMIKKQQVRWNRWTVQPFLDVRVAVLNGTLLPSFRKVFPNFHPADNPGPVALAA